MFSRQALLAVLAASAALMCADAFAPAARPISLGCQRTSAIKPIAVGLAIEDDIGTEEDAGEEIISASELEGEEGAEEAIPARFLSAQRIQELREQHRRHETDTGSPEYQVAGMTERINHLTNHLKDHPKDFSTRRGLVALVNKRRRLLNYLFSEDEKRYADIVSALGVRHRVPGAIATKEDLYGRFPRQKSNKGKSKNKA